MIASWLENSCSDKFISSSRSSPSRKLLTSCTVMPMRWSVTRSWAKLYVRIFSDLPFVPIWKRKRRRTTRRMVYFFPTLHCFISPLPIWTGKNCCFLFSLYWSMIYYSWSNSIPISSQIQPLTSTHLYFKLHFRFCSSVSTSKDVNSPGFCAGCSACWFPPPTSCCKVSLSEPSWPFLCSSAGIAPAGTLQPHLRNTHKHKNSRATIKETRRFHNSCCKQDQNRATKQRFINAHKHVTALTTSDFRENGWIHVLIFNTLICPGVCLLRCGKEQF